MDDFTGMESRPEYHGELTGRPALSESFMNWWRLTLALAGFG